MASCLLTEKQIQRSDAFITIAVHLDLLNNPNDTALNITFTFFKRLLFLEFFST